MQPGSATDDRANRKRPRPPSGILGWASAWSVLEHIDNTAQRNALVDMVRHAGVHGAGPLKYLALHLLWLTGMRAEHPSSPDRMSAADARWVQARAEQIAARCDRKLFPKAKR